MKKIFSWMFFGMLFFLVSPAFAGWFDWLEKNPKIDPAVTVNPGALPACSSVCREELAGPPGPMGPAGPVGAAESTGRIYWSASVPMNLLCFDNPLPPFTAARGSLPGERRYDVCVFQDPTATISFPRCGEGDVNLSMYLGGDYNMEMYSSIDGVTEKVIAHRLLYPRAEGSDSTGRSPQTRHVSARTLCAQVTR